MWATKAPKGSKHKYTFNYQEMKAENGGKQMKTVWRFPAAGRDEKVYGKHPTQKPVALIDRCLRASTNPGDLVLDPFAGTAATGVAALKSGRHFVSIEQDSDYTDIGNLRLTETAGDGGDKAAISAAVIPDVQKRLLETAGYYVPACTT